MLKRARLGLAVAGCVMLSGCWHQVVSTGLAPGATEVKKPWTSTWIFGLVEAKPINVRQECPSGVAFVSTKHTVVNSLAGMLTLGIWTPVDVTVTCAGGRASITPGMIRMPLGASTTESVELAVKVSSEKGETVALVWEPAFNVQSEATR